MYIPTCCRFPSLPFPLPPGRKLLVLFLLVYVPLSCVLSGPYFSWLIVARACQDPTAAPATDLSCSK